MNSTTTTPTWYPSRTAFPEAFLARRMNAYQAYYEFMPLEDPSRRART